MMAITICLFSLYRMSILVSGILEIAIGTLTLTDQKNVM